jgi:hypothetical protein
MPVKITGAIMIPDVISGKYIDGYKIELSFDNRKKGIVDFSKYLNAGGVFERFKDIEFFKDFSINKDLGVITWRGELDVSPETLYSEATGSPLPSWVEH